MGSRRGGPRECPIPPGCCRGARPLRGVTPRTEAESALLEVPLSSRPVGTIILCEPMVEIFSAAPTQGRLRTPGGGTRPGSPHIFRGSGNTVVKRRSLRDGPDGTESPKSQGNLGNHPRPSKIGGSVAGRPVGPLGPDTFCRLIVRFSVFCFLEVSPCQCQSRRSVASASQSWRNGLRRPSPCLIASWAIPVIPIIPVIQAIQAIPAIPAIPAMTGRHDPCDRQVEVGL